MCIYKKRVSIDDLWYWVKCRNGRLFLGCFGFKTRQELGNDTTRTCANHSLCLIIILISVELLIYKCYIVQQHIILNQYKSTNKTTFVYFNANNINLDSAIECMGWWAYLAWKSVTGENIQFEDSYRRIMIIIYQVNYTKAAWIMTKETR